MTRDGLKKFLLAFTAVYLLVAAGFAIHHTQVTLSEEEQAKTAAQEAAAKRPPLLKPGDEAPDFMLTSVDGDEIQLSSFQGKKYVLLEFFATWCPHCQHSVPVVEELANNNPQKLQVLAINAGYKPPQRSLSQEFKAQYHITYPILEDVPFNLLTDGYHISGFPTFYLVDLNGKIAWRYNGTLDQIHVNQIEALLK